VDGGPSRVRSSLFCSSCIGLASEVANNRLFDALNEAIAPPDTPPGERIIRTFEYVSDWNSFDANRIPSLPARLLARLEHASPVHVSARSALSAGTDKPALPVHFHDLSLFSAGPPSLTLAKRSSTTMTHLRWEKLPGLPWVR
jgi:hypothetical protein